MSAQKNQPCKYKDRMLPFLHLTWAGRTGPASHISLMRFPQGRRVKTDPFPRKGPESFPRLKWKQGGACPASEFVLNPRPADLRKGVGGGGQRGQGAVITTYATVVERSFMLQGYRKHLFNMSVQLRNPDPSFLAPIQTDTTSVLRIGAPSNILCP